MSSHGLSRPPAKDRPTRASARRVLAVLVVVAAVVLGLVGVGASRHWSWPGGADPEVPGAPTQGGSATASAAATPDPAAALTDLLDRRANALRARDRLAWLATVDPANTALVQGQGALFDRLLGVPFSSVEFRYSSAGPALSQAQQTALGSSAWIAKIVFAYRFTDVSDTEIRREQYLTLAQRNGEWFVAGTGDGAGEKAQRDLWDLGPVHVYTGRRSLVISTAAQGLSAWANRVDAAADRVDKVWGTGWPRRVVVLVPDSQTEMAALLGRTDESGLDQIAAVTTGESAMAVGQSADRVILNPAGFRRLDDVGRRIVLTHEVTHVATRSAGPGEIPIWFSEGFADFVAYTTNTDVSVDDAVHGYLAQFRGNDTRPSLPTAADFDATTSQDLTPAYSAAFLAVDYLSQVYGRDALLELYHAQAGDAGLEGAATTPLPLQRAMPQVLDGLTEEQFTAGWAAWVRSKAAEATASPTTPRATGTG